MSVPRKKPAKSPRPDGELGDAAPIGTDVSVTIACKLPNGMLLQLFDIREVTETGPGGYRHTHKLATPRREEQYVVRGTGEFRGFDSKKAHDLVAGYALTHGIPKKFWDAWVKQTGQYLDAVTNRFIFAYAKPADAAAAAKDVGSDRTQRTGFEPLDPSGIGNNGRVVVRDPRLRDVVGKGVSPPTSFERNDGN